MRTRKREEIFGNGVVWEVVVGVVLLQFEGGSFVVVEIVLLQGSANNARADTAPFWWVEFEFEADGGEGMNDVVRRRLREWTVGMRYYSRRRHGIVCVYVCVCRSHSCSPFGFRD